MKKKTLKERNSTEMTSRETISRPKCITNKNDLWERKELKVLNNEKLGMGYRKKI